MKQKCISQHVKNGSIVIRRSKIWLWCNSFWDIARLLQLQSSNQAYCVCVCVLIIVVLMHCCIVYAFVIFIQESTNSRLSKAVAESHKSRRNNFVWIHRKRRSKELWTIHRKFCFSNKLFECFEAFYSVWNLWNILEGSTVQTNKCLKLFEGKEKQSRNE